MQASECLSLLPLAGTGGGLVVAEKWVGQRWREVRNGCGGESERGAKVSESDGEGWPVTSPPPEHRPAC